MCFKIAGPSLQGQAQECSDGDCVGDRKAYRVDLFTVRLRLCVCVRMCACVRRGSVLRYRCIPDDNNSLTPGAMATRKRSVCAGGLNLTPTSAFDTQMKSWCPTPRGIQLHRGAGGLPLNVQGFFKRSDLWRRKSVLGVASRGKKNKTQPLFVVFPPGHKQSSECKQKLTPTFIFFF